MKLADLFYRNERQWFWVREMLHFLGGLLIGLGADLLVHFTGWWGVIILVFIILQDIILLKEIWEYWRGVQSLFKTYCDMAMWILGYAVAAWPMFLT